MDLRDYQPGKRVGRVGLTSSKRKMRSSSHTFSKQRSSDSTKTYPLVSINPIEGYTFTHLNEIEYPQFTLTLVHHEHEIQRSIMSVDDPQILVVRPFLLAILPKSKAWWELDKVAERVVSDRDEVEDALEDRCSGLRGRGLGVEASVDSSSVVRVTRTE